VKCRQLQLTHPQLPLEDDVVTTTLRTSHQLATLDGCLLPQQPMDTPTLAPTATRVRALARTHTVLLKLRPWDRLHPHPHPHLHPHPRRLPHRQPTVSLGHRPAAPAEPQLLLPPPAQHRRCQQHVMPIVPRHLRRSKSRSYCALPSAREFHRRSNQREPTPKGPRRRVRMRSVSP
jgi:hypothetical protein